MKNWIIIGTDLETKKFEEKYDKLKRKLQKEETMLDVKYGNLEEAKQQLQDVENKFRNIQKEQKEINKLIEEQQNKVNIFNQRIENGERLTAVEWKKYEDATSEINELREKQQQINNEYDKYNEKINKSYDLLTKNEIAYDNQKNKVIEIRGEIEKIETDRVQKNVQQTANSIKKVGNGINDVIKKIAKWALAIFGIRTAYNMILRSINIISQGNNQLKADIDYMRNILAYTLEPIVEKIVNFLKQMLIYVGYIIYKWTGKNIFANADKSLKNANKSANALQKTLAGFDEMNIVGNKNNETQPSFNLAQEVDKFSKDKEPAWMSWIITNGPKVAKIIAIIGAAIAGLKFGIFLSQSIRFVKEVLGPIGAFLLKHAGVIIKIGGLLAIIGGIITLVKGLIDYLKDPTWDNFMKILTGIFLIAGGIALVFGGIPGLIALITGAVVALGVAIYKKWDEIKSWFSNMGEKVEKNIIKPIKDKFRALPNWFKTLIKGLINGIITLINGFIIRLNEKLTPLRAAIGAIGGMFGAKWTLGQVAIPTIKYLANGGIINLPGKGVPLNIGGENGPEGVVPLTNEQQMDLLGKTIAKYLTIDLTNITNLDGRTIARSIKKIQGQNDFLMNR